MAFLARIQQAQVAGSDRLRAQCEQATTLIVEEFGQECVAVAERNAKSCTFSNKGTSILALMNAIDSLDRQEKVKVFLDTLRRQACTAFGDTVSVLITYHCGRYKGQWKYGQDAATASPDFAWEKIELSLTFPKPSAKLPQAAEARSSLNGPCAICLEVVPVVALVPCGHCVCVGCQGRLPQGLGCPVCRGAVAGHQNLFGA